METGGRTDLNQREISRADPETGRHKPPARRIVRVLMDYIASPQVFLTARLNAVRSRDGIARSEISPSEQTVSRTSGFNRRGGATMRPAIVSSAMPSRATAR